MLCLPHFISNSRYSYDTTSNQMVKRAGVGPKPCPIVGLTTPILVEKLRELTSPTIKEAAVKMAAKMNAEDGVMSAMEHFWFSLPRDSMMCSISLIMGKSLLAKYRMKNSIPVSEEVASVLVDSANSYDLDLDLDLDLPDLPNALPGKSLVGSLKGRAVRKHTNVKHTLVPYATVTYALRHRGGYNTLTRGLLSATQEFFQSLITAFVKVFRVPDKFSRNHGLLGCIAGCFVMPFYFAYAIFRMVVITIDRFGVTIANNVFGRQWLYFIDSSARAKVYRDDVQNIPPVEVSNVSVHYIVEARKVAIDARKLFLQCNPKFAEHHWHWREASVDVLVNKLEKSQDRLDITDLEFETLKERFASFDKETISFSRFCLFIGEAIHARFTRLREPETRDRFSDAYNCYLT